LGAQAVVPEGQNVQSESISTCRHERTRSIWKLLAHLAQRSALGGSKGKESVNGESVISERGREMLDSWAMGGPILVDDNNFKERLEPGELARLVAAEAIRRAGIEKASLGSGTNSRTEVTDSKLEEQLKALAAESDAAVSDGDEAFLLGQEEAAVEAYAKGGILGLPRVLAVHVHRCVVSAAVSVMHLAEDLCEKAGRKENDCPTKVSAFPDGGKPSDDQDAALQMRRERLETQCRKHPRVMKAVFASMCKEFGLLMAAWSRISPAKGPVSKTFHAPQPALQLAFPSPLSWRGLGFDGRRVRVDPQSFAQSVERFESGASEAKEPGELQGEKQVEAPSVEEPGGKSSPRASSLGDHKTERRASGTPFSNPSRRSSVAEDNQDLSDDVIEGAPTTDAAFALATRIVEMNLHPPVCSPGQVAAGGEAESQPGGRSSKGVERRELEKERKEAEHRFWAIAAAVDWLVKGGEVEAAGALLRGADGWRQAAELGMK
jgi:hypothetical protein